MSDSDNEHVEGIDKEALHRLEANDIKVDKKAKRIKRLANQDIKLDESGSEVEDDDKPEKEGSDAEEENDGTKVKKGKHDVILKHKPLQKTVDEIKKSQFLGEKYGHFKIGSYLRIEVELDKDVSRKL